MHYIFYIALLGFISFDARAADGTMVVLNPGTLVQHKGPTNTAALSQQNLLSGIELTQAENILIDKFQKYKPGDTVSITADDYRTLLSRLAVESDRKVASSDAFDPELVAMFVAQYINGCFVLNLHPVIKSGRVITRLIGDMNRKRKENEPEIADTEELRETLNTSELQGKLRMFNDAFKASQQQFIQSPYDALYSVLNVPYKKASGGDELKQYHSWQYLLPICRQELEYLKQNRNQGPAIKRYTYYVTNLINQITSGTHDQIDVSARTVVNTADPNHQQFLGSLIDSGAAAFNVHMQFLYMHELSQLDKGKNSFSAILKNYLKEFFPAQQHLQLQNELIFNHQLNAYIIFALGAYEPHIQSLANHEKDEEKYAFIKKRIIDAIGELESSANMRLSMPEYQLTGQIWDEFHIPILSDSITPQLLDQIKNTLKRNPGLIQAIDEYYVQPILRAEKEEKKEWHDEGWRVGPKQGEKQPLLRLGIDPTLVQQGQHQAEAQIQAGGAPAAPPPPSAPPPPPSAVPVPPKGKPPARPTPQAQPPAPQPAPNFMADIRKGMQLKKVAQEETPQGQKGKAPTAGGMVGLFGVPADQLQKLREAVAGKDDGKDDDDDNDWD
jgi:hypothetical protein